MGTTLALIELSGTPAELHVAAYTAGETLHCEFRQDAYMVDSHQLTRLLDMESSDRAGGRTIAVSLSAARRVAQLHGGAFDVRPAASGGTTFLFSLPAVGGSSVPVKTN
jgi:signal transduction histidine kinase